MNRFTSKSKQIVYPLATRSQAKLSWGRIITLAAVLAVASQLMLPFSPASIAPVTFAQTSITVNSTADAVTNDGNCTLREAITAANTNAAVDACPAGSGAGADIIDLPGGTITIAIPSTDEELNVDGDYDISQDLEINGNGTTIDGATISRIFHILGGTTTMTDLTITNGNSPGNIALSIGRGGGARVEAGATLNLTDVQVTGNSATTGGGLNTDGVVNLNRVTIDTNSATASGGALRADFFGTFNGTNVTISDNQTASSGAIRLLDDAIINFTHATIASNQGGDQIRTTERSNVTLVNSIVADPIGGVNCTLVNAVVGSSNNLDSGASCGFPAGESNVDPLLLPLANNGGSTPTRAFSLNPTISPAIDRIPAGSCTAAEDQRTEPRPVDVPGYDNGGTCDVGAYEFVDVPEIQITDVAQNELNTGTSVMDFTVSLVPTVDTTVTVDYQSNDGTATIADNDYVALAPATLTFPPNTGSQIVSVTINGDTNPEPDEVFTIDLSNAVWATILDNQGQGTIRNDEIVPAVSIADAPAVAEGNSVGANSSVFDVTLDVVSTQPVTVTYQTSDGTALAGIDYVPVTSGQLVFAPGEDQKTISVQIVGDTLIDTPAVEDFFVDLTGVVGGTIADNQGRAVINDDDANVALPTLSISPASIKEGNSGTVTMSFEVTLSAASATPVSVDYATSDGTATAGSDYIAASGTLIFAAGQQAQTVMVTINGDKSKEKDETFTVTLSNPVNATIATASATGTITNDDNKSSGGSSNNDDDGGSAPPPPPAPAQPASSAAPPPPAVPATLPVTNLPETGLDGGSSMTMPWFLITGIGVGAVALIWNVQRRRKNRKS